MKIKESFLQKVAENGVLYTPNYCYKAMTMIPSADDQKNLVPSVILIIRIPMRDGKYDPDYYEKVACLDNTIRHKKIG